MANRKLIPHSRALEIHEDIAAWMSTEAAYEHVAVDHLRMISALPGNAGLEPDPLFSAYKDEIIGAYDSEAAALKATTPTFCTEDFGTMLLAMAETAPGGNIGVDDFTDKSGLLIFQEAIDVRAVEPNDLTLHGIRALSFTVMSYRDAHVLLLRYWSEGLITGNEKKVPGRTRLRAGHPCLTPLAVSGLDQDFAVVRLLRSYFALIKSPISVVATEPRNTKINPRTKRSLRTDAIRRVYLRHPEHARYEADEAAAAREGRAPMRAHWVRGHWRNQHYSTAGEHRWIWIDGYIKGNPEHGTMSTRKVAVARADPSELRELVGAVS